MQLSVSSAGLLVMALAIFQQAVSSPSCATAEMARAGLSAGQGFQNETSQIAGLHPAEGVIRWHPQGRYLLTDFGVAALSSDRPVPPDIADQQPRARRLQSPQFAGCDWLSGDQIVVSSLKWDYQHNAQQHLFTVRLDNGDRKPLVTKDFANENACPVVEPGGKRIAFVSSKGVCVVNADGSNPRVLLKTGDYVIPRTPKWCPRGRRFLATVSQKTYVTYLVDADTGRSQKIDLSSAGCWIHTVEEASWSPDGQSIVFACYGKSADGWGRLAVLHLKDRPIRMLVVLTGDQHYLNYAAWSPDGKQIAYVVDFSDLMLVDVVTKKTRRLYASKQHLLLDSNPTWLPDGKGLAFWRTSRGESAGVDLLRVSTKGEPRVERL